jgi:DME family drug/metabolite transporter
MSADGRERGWGMAAIFFAAVVWGTTGTAATLAPDVSAAAIGAAAMGIGGLLQAAIALKGIRHSRRLLAQQWRMLALGALAVAVYPLAFYGSMRLAGITIGTVVSLGSAPLLAALIEYRLEGLRLTRRWAIGAALGLGGMLLLSLVKGHGHAAAGASSSVTTGVLLGLVAGLTYALYSWCARRLMQRAVPPMAAMGATFGVGGLLLMPVLMATGAPFLASWNNALVGIYMALVPMFLGYVCFGYGLARVQASTATTITLFEPVVAAGLAVWIVGEQLPVMGWIGVGLIVVCLVLMTMPARRRTQHAHSPVSAGSGSPTALAADLARS